MENKIETYYQNQGKLLIDTLFDAKIFAEKITRNDLQAFEDFAAYLFQSEAYSAKKIAAFKARWELKEKAH